ncbi:YjcZ family sporulation protein [Bacillus cereus]
MFILLIIIGTACFC